jgi:hypothetical protein
MEPITHFLFFPVMVSQTSLESRRTVSEMSLMEQTRSSLYNNRLLRACPGESPVPVSGPITGFLRCRSMAINLIKIEPGLIFRRINDRDDPVASLLNQQIIGRE